MLRITCCVLALVHVKVASDKHCHCISSLFLATLGALIFSRLPGDVAFNFEKPVSDAVEVFWRRISQDAMKRK